MKIPNKVKVGQQVFDVVITPFDDDNCADIDLKTMTIKIDSSLPTIQKELSMIHEVIHAINWKMSEEKVEYLSQALYSVFKENNWLK